MKTMENGAAISANNHTSRYRKQEIDWGKYGLAERSLYEPRKPNNSQNLSQNESISEVRELFDEDGEVGRLNILQIKNSSANC